MTRRAALERSALAAALLITAAAGWALAGRDGYSPDEELTLFAVKGIAGTGVPALPSGLTYWRGPLYSYLAWLAGVGFGFTLEWYRLVSVLASAAAVLCTYAIARRLSAFGAAAPLLLAAMPAFLAVTPYARFYSPLIAALVGAVWVTVSGRSIWTFLVVALAARGFHELGVTAILVPVGFALASAPLHRSFQSVMNHVLVTAALLTHHFLLVALQRGGIGGEAAAAPWAWLGAPVPLLQTAPLLPTATAIDWLAMAMFFGAAIWWIARGLAWRDIAFVIASAAFAALLSLGTVAALCVLWLIARPSGWRRHITIALLFALAGGLAWVTVIGVRTETLITPRFAVDLFQAALRTHLDGARVLAGQFPIATALCLLALLPAADPRVSPTIRAVAVLLWMQTILLGIFGVDVRTRFIAVMTPALAILAATGVERVVAALRAPSASAGRLAVAAAIAVLLPAVVLEQRRVVHGLIDRPLTTQWWSAWAPPAGLSRSSDPALRALIGSDTVVTNDELAALLLAGRADYWWAADAFTAAFFGRLRDGRLHGIYGGTPALIGEQGLATLSGPPGRGISVIWFTSGKFGGAPERLHDESSWRPGTFSRLTPDWFLVRMPPIGSPP